MPKFSRPRGPDHKTVITSRVVTLQMDPSEARALWHAACTTVELIDQVGEIPSDAPLHGQRERLVGVARRLDHEINHRGRVA